MQQVFGAIQDSLGLIGIDSTSIDCKPTVYIDGNNRIKVRLDRIEAIHQGLSLSKHERGLGIKVRWFENGISMCLKN